MLKHWIFGPPEDRHQITMEINWSSRIEIKLDGKKVVDETPFNNLRAVYSFTDGHRKYVLTVSRAYLIYRRTYALRVDGVLVPENKD